MDYDKIRQEKRLDISKIERFFGHEFTKREIYKDSDGFYVDRDFASFGGMVWRLSETSWFMNNVKAWIWYNSDGHSNPNEYTATDLIKHYREKKLGTDFTKSVCIEYFTNILQL